MASSTVVRYFKAFWIRQAHAVRPWEIKRHWAPDVPSSTWPEPKWSFLPNGRMAVQAHILGSVAWSSGRIESKLTVEEWREQSFRNFCGFSEDAEWNSFFGMLSFLQDLATNSRKGFNNRFVRSDLWDARQYERDIEHVPTRASHLYKIMKYLEDEKMALLRFQCEHLDKTTGYGPETAREGDSVVLVAGVTLPMLLRHRTSGFEVVGPAFLPALAEREGGMWHGCDNLEEIVLQ